MNLIINLLTMQDVSFRPFDKWKYVHLQHHLVATTLYYTHDAL